MSVATVGAIPTWGLLVLDSPRTPVGYDTQGETKMLGGGKPIAECTKSEIVTMLVAASIIGLSIILVTVFSGQPEWFAWFVGLFVIVALAGTWQSGLRELRERRRFDASGKSDKGPANQQ